MISPGGTDDVDHRPADQSYGRQVDPKGAHRTTSHPQHRTRVTRDGERTSIGEAFDPRSNSFGFLRTVFALLVVVDHAFPLGGYNSGVDPMWAWTKGQEDIGGMAVAGFFVLSGFLVTRSFEGSPNVVRYLWKRILRIFPGFWVCLAVTALVFGTIATLYQHGTLSGYFNVSGVGPVGYAYHNAFLNMNQWDINGLLYGTPYSHTGYPQAFDGSLWTLIYEFKCYIGVAILGMLTLTKRGRRIGPIGLSLLFWVAQIEDSANPHLLAGIPLIGDINMARLGFIFSLGMLLYLYRQSIPCSWTLSGVAVVVYLVGMRTGLYEGIGQVAFAYLCLFAAITLPLKSFDKYGDFSYGIYIYSFPIEQLCALFGAEHLGYPAYVVISIAGTMVFAVPSWFLVERPCLRLKGVRFAGIANGTWLPVGRRERKIAVSEPDPSTPRETVGTDVPP